MHVLLTNDDGPPSEDHSPYVHYLIEAIKKYTDWKLSIALPASQKSWIAKAHLIGHDVAVTYLYSEKVNNDLVEYRGPFQEPQEELKAKADTTELILLDGTPASCANIGLHGGLFADKDPFDLVISGPNYGRNSGAVYIMSSGTVGAALEGAVCGYKSIALSYAFETRQHDKAQIEMGSKISCKLIQYLYDNWNPEVDVYAINVPLSADLSESSKIKYAHILPNSWASSFTKQGNIFKWDPDFDSIEKSVEESKEIYPHNDALALQQGIISVTSIKAKFAEVPMSGEITLPKNVCITIDKESYVYSILVDAFKQSFDSVNILDKLPSDGGNSKIFHYGEYEDLDFDRIGRDDNYLSCSYVYRKGLIRKHYLAHTIRMYTAKHPDCALARAFPESFDIEVDYAEFLDDALDEAYELRQELETEKKLWILKPAMSDRAQGIRVFRTIDELQAIFDSFEEGEDDEDDENDEATEQERTETVSGQELKDVESDTDDRRVIISQLRHFVIQEYVENPMILEKYDNRKFHLRVYVLCVGDLKVYVYRDILALFALKSYDVNATDLASHLTNTCIQGENSDDLSVQLFWELGIENADKIFTQISQIVGDLFKAAIADRVNFQSVSNAIEFYGLDFLVDADAQAHLLEVNAYPDFKQTGEKLRPLVEGLFKASVEGPISEFYELNGVYDDRLVLVHESEGSNQGMM